MHGEVTPICVSGHRVGFGGLDQQIVYAARASCHVTSGIRREGESKYYDNDHDGMYIIR